MIKNMVILLCVITSGVQANVYILQVIKDKPEAAMSSSRLCDCAQMQTVDDVCRLMDAYAHDRRFVEYDIVALGRGKTMLDALGYATRVLGVDLSNKYGSNEVLQEHLRRVHADKGDADMYIFAQFSRGDG